MDFETFWEWGNMMGNQEICGTVFRLKVDSFLEHNFSPFFSTHEIILIKNIIFAPTIINCNKYHIFISISLN